MRKALPPGHRDPKGASECPAGAGGYKMPAVPTGAEGVSDFWLI